MADSIFLDNQSTTLTDPRPGYAPIRGGRRGGQSALKRADETCQGHAMHVIRGASRWPSCGLAVLFERSGAQHDEMMPQRKAEFERLPERAEPGA